MVLVERSGIVSLNLATVLLLYEVLVSVFMSNQINVSLVCCDDSPSKLSRIVELKIDSALLEDRLISSAEQEVDANEAKGLHLAAHHADHGVVTYLQQVNEGGFFVYVGDPQNLQEHWFGPGTYVAFNDDQGPGHASKVGPEGCKRTFRMLRDHLEIPS